MFKKKIVLWLALFIIVVNFSYLAIAKEKENSIYEELPLLADTITIVQSDYVEEVDPQKLIYGALQGMLSSLDKHSQFMDPDTYKEMKVETKGEFGGLGIVITIKDDLLTIISPIDDTPAYKVGIKAGDKIIKIDGESTKDITLIDAVKKMRGKPGTQCMLTVLREGEQKFLEFTITRAIIKIESIKEAKVIEDKIGYIRLIEFQEKTPEELEKALKQLERKGIESLILDLRNNPGGLLNVAVKVADKFLPENEVIVSTRGRRPEQDIVFKSTSQGAHRDYPLIVLINEGSASASEIVAGAIRDHNRGMLLGHKSFGKGSVQTVIPLSDGSGLRLTTAKYFTPSGICIHDIGIEPDILVDLETKEEEEEKEVLEKKVEVVEELKEEETPPDDQLLRAIELLKQKSITPTKF